MISYIYGKPQKKFIKGKDYIVDILTSGGVGYRLNVTASTYSSLEKVESLEEVGVFCHLQVREDSQVLYGFFTEAERDMFEMLITVSGVGPKTGVVILSFYKPEELSQLIFEKNDKLLSKVPGLGAKSAQKIIIELHNKILNLVINPEGFVQSGSQGSKIITELEDALKSLGFKSNELSALIKKGQEIISNSTDIKIENLIERVLRK